jgi:hypothetical protein
MPSIDVADNVVALLNSQAFTPAAAAVRKHLPEADQDGPKTVQIFVRNSGLANGLSALDAVSRRKDYPVDVIVWANLDPNQAYDDPATVDPLVRLVEAVSDRLLGSTIASGYTGLDADCIDVVSAGEDLFDVDKLEQHKIFEAILTATFRVEL